MSSKSIMESDEGSSSATSVSKYEVFLSFRGPDTRSGFTDYLYTRFIDAGIRVFRDNEELRKGQEIGPELLKGIKESTIAIPIFSKNYAASKWCLKELEQIVKCRRSTELKVMPIFYDVTPSDVRHQTGDYAKAFESHEKCYDKNTIISWKAALKEVGKLSGWDFHSSTDRLEGKLVKEVTEVVLRELKKAYLIVSDHLVGVDHHVKEILGKLCADISAVQIFGIYGMGGIGKTTLAKVIYNLLLPNFECHSFLPDIRETYRIGGMKFLCQNLISDILGKESANISNVDDAIRIMRERFSNKKVVILMDDVDDIPLLQLRLLGQRDWFGCGSRIIITTRNKTILDSFHVDWSYELGHLKTHKALRLFSKHAFRKDNPPKEYLTLSQKAVQIAGGLPLALEVFGSLLYGNSGERWDTILKQLQKVPHEDVRGKLNISFEALNVQQKQIFLDIACFFIGMNYGLVIHFWEDPKDAMEILQQMSLVKIKGHQLWMHDQLRDLGREIVREEHIEHGKRSRLWNTEEATELFMRNMGDENIEGIYLDTVGQSPYNYCSSDRFAGLPNLRLLRVDYNYPLPHDKRKSLEARNFRDRLYSKVKSLEDSLPLPRGPFVFSKLRWFSWHRFPGMHKSRNISFENLSILDLSYSTITSSWGGWSGVKMAKNLKVLNLTGCVQLVKTPDLSCHLLLEQLLLQYCDGLVEIDESISMLQHLVIINLTQCSRLKKLPKELSCSESLEELHISWTGIVEIPSWPLMRRLRVFDSVDCSHLKKVSSLDFAVNITELLLASSRITILPESIGKLVNLLKLSLQCCKKIKTLPESIGDLLSLIEINLEHSGIVELPNTIVNLRNLKKLTICWTPLRRLPTAIGQMENLERIDANLCCELHDIPKLPPSLISLKVSQARTPRIPDLSNLINLKHLKLSLEDGPVDPLEASSSAPWWIGRFINLETLSLQSKCIISLHEDLSSLKKLKDLEVRFCPNLVEIRGIDMLENLEKLSIGNSAKLQSLPDLSKLKKLRDLEVQVYPNLVEICGIDMLENLGKLSIRDCAKLQALPNLSSLKKLRDLYVESCPNLVEIPGIDMLKSLENLSIMYCAKLQSLPDLSNLKKLNDLEVKSCPNLVEIPGIDMLESLKNLSIRHCAKFQSLPDLSNLKKLKDLEVKCCPNLVEITGRLESLSTLHLKDCQSLEKCPDIPNRNTMDSFSIKRCGKKATSSLKLFTCT